MGETKQDIKCVRASLFPAGISTGGKLAGVPGLMLVSWQSSYTDKLFQVYVNGRWAQVTDNPLQRQLLAAYDGTDTALVEILAVEPQNAYHDYSDMLNAYHLAGGSHAVLRWCRRAALPWQSKVYIYTDAGSGQIDYDTPLAVRDVWPGLEEKWGWGLEAFGQGDWGYSGSGAVGWGRGSFGNGEFGFDAVMDEFRSEALAPGRYRFALHLANRCGNIATDTVETTVFIDSCPQAVRLAVAQYDQDADRLTLAIQA